MHTFSGANMRMAMTVALVSCCLACGVQPTSSSPSGTTERIQALYSRQLTLPTLTPGAACPLSEVQVFGPSQPKSKQAERSQVPSRVSGTWPVFMTSQTSFFAGQAVELCVSSEYLGPLLVRGRQIDGPAGMPLAQAPWSSSPAVGAQGLELTGASDPGWRAWSGQIAGGTGPGCYGLQADGFTFTSMLIFSVSTGTGPPA